MPSARTTDGGGHDVIVFHNPSCSKSRGALGILDDRSIDYGVVEYLVAPPSRETLEMIVAKLVDPVSDLIRTTDQKFLDLGLDPGDYADAESVIEFLLAHPELMQRPVVIRGDRAVIARPESRVADILD